MDGKSRRYNVVDKNSLKTNVNDGDSAYVNGIRNFRVEEVLSGAKLVRKNLKDERNNLYVSVNLDSEKFTASLSDQILGFLQGFMARNKGGSVYHEKAKAGIEEFLQSGKQVNIYAHSQGNTIALQTILMQQDKLRNGQITYYGFAPANDGSQIVQYRKNLLNEKSKLFYNSGDLALSLSDVFSAELSLNLNWSSKVNKNIYERTTLLGFKHHNFTEENFQWGFDIISGRKVAPSSFFRFFGERIRRLERSIEAFYPYYPR